MPKHRKGPRRARAEGPLREGSRAGSGFPARIPSRSRPPQPSIPEAEPAWPTALAPQAGGKARGARGHRFPPAIALPTSTARSQQPQPTRAERRSQGTSHETALHAPVPPVARGPDPEPRSGPGCQTDQGHGSPSLVLSRALVGPLNEAESVLEVLWAARRFWSKVDRSRGPTACWPWTAYRKETGYGRVKIGGRMQRAHRVAFRLTFGPIPRGWAVCHRCDNPPCCNPAHLFAGPTSANNHDKRAKGRARNGDQRGACNPAAKLSGEAVAEIRRRYRRGTYGCKRLAREFGVTFQQIHNIVTKRSWQGG